MKRTTEVVIFFSSLLVIGILVVGGILYFNDQKPETTPSPVPSVVQSQSVQTIPTSTITIPAPPTSSAPLTALTLPYSVNAMTANTTYWPKDWGSISFIKGGIAFTPAANPVGANSFLNGAASWSNYQVSTNVSSLNGGWFDIVARVSNNTQNFVYCEFGSNGTEIIERVNAADTQLAFSAASSTGAQGGPRHFSMQVYGNDVACSIGGEEVVGVHVQNGESAEGGIGFVIFGQTATQQQVALSNVSVTALTADTITAPFSFAVAVPPPATPPPAAAAPPAPVAPPASTTAPGPAPIPTKTLPYSATGFVPADWIDGWGGSFAGNGVLTVGASSSTTSGGIFLAGSEAWTDYLFTADLDLVKGSAFDIVGRRTDNSHFIECIFTDLDSPVEYLNINRISGNDNQVMGSGETFIPNAAHIPYNDIQVSMEVQGQNIECSIDGATVTDNVSNGLPPVLMNGGIGFISWDPATNNSEIVVKQISVTPL